MGQNPGSAGFAMPDGEDATVRRIKDLERTVRENAAARSLEAASIGAGGITVKNGGSIRVEAPGTIDLTGGAFTAASVTASGTVTGATVVATGNATVGGNATVTGNVTGANVTGGNVFAQSIATNITAGRVTVWGRTSDGFLGTATSSERFKTNIRPLDIDAKAEKICQIVVSYFEYIEEVRKRDDPDYEFYVGAHYHVGTNMGAIAERLHELGLWEWVVYEREMVYEPGPIDDREQSEEMFLPGVWVEHLKLNANGEPIPTAIHDILIGWAALIVAQSNARRIAAIEDRLIAAGI